MFFQCEGLGKKINLGLNFSPPSASNTIDAMETLTIEPEIAIREAAQRGEEEAMGRLIQAYQSRVFRYVARLVPQPADAEDLTQEVLLEMVRSLKTFRGESSLTTWVFRVATNKIADFFRTRAKRQTFSFEDRSDDRADALPEIPDHRPGPLELLNEQERTTLVDRVFGALPEIYRSVLLLRVHEGLSYQQIAEATGCAVGTVKSRMHYGMVLMGKGLADHTAEGR